MNEALQRILEAGNSAPSGENAQPWRFALSGNVIELYLITERDQSAYNWGQRSSYLALGAVLENIYQAASAERLRAEISYFPSENEKHVATITFVEDPDVETSVLAPEILRRVTNRKPFSTAPLLTEEKAALQAASSQEGVELGFVEDRENVRRIARVGSTNEEIMLGNRLLHDFFFGHVSWTKEEDDRKKVGFFIKTLELPPPAEAMFRLFRNWNVMRIFKALGFPKVVANQNAKTNAAASAMGAILLEHTEPLDFIHAGRAIERIWLTATKLGLSLQPLTGVLFFKLRIENDPDVLFSSSEKERVLRAYAIASKLFNARSQHLAFMFRVGRGNKPSAQAKRFSLAQSSML